MTWNLVPLANLLVRSEDAVDIVPTESYSEVTVRLWGKGVVLRGEVQGQEIGATRRFRVRAGQFILSRIDARNGALGIVPAALDGAVVSNDFPTYSVVQDGLLVPFLGWLSRTKRFVDLCLAASEGTTNRVRLKEDRFLATTIPLPPLSEQRRIVAKVEELAAKIDEARGLQQKNIVASNTLVASGLKWAFDAEVADRHWNTYPVGEVASVSRGKFTHRPRNDPRFYGGDIPFIQINDISSSNRYITSYSQTLNEEGLLISRMFPVGTVVIAITGATVGATGILGIESCFPDSIVGFQAIPEKTFSEYLYWALEHVKANALAEATQTTQPNINLQILNRLSVPLPPLPEQRRIVAYLDDLQSKVDSLKALQSQSATELDALLPSILDKAFKGEF